MKNKLILSILALGFSVQTLAVQPVYGQSAKDSPYEDGAPAGSSSHLGNVEDYYGKMKADSSKKEEQTTEQKTKWMNNVQGESSNIPKLGDNKYLEFRNKNLIKDFHKISNDSWGFTYIKDTYDYKDRNDIFKRTFGSEGDKDAVQSGYLLGQYKHNWYRGFADLYTEINSGLSYNAGKGRFSDDNSVSETTMKLWIIPIDFLVGFKLHLGRYIGLTVAGGPSVVALMQNRSDRNDEDDDKDIRQVGYGYTALGSLEFSLSQIFHDFGTHLRAKSDLSDMSLVFTLRNTAISNFNSKDVEITGSSLGLGFKFEYL